MIVFLAALRHCGTVIEKEMLLLIIPELHRFTDVMVLLFSSCVALNREKLAADMQEQVLQTSWPSVLHLY